MVVLINSTSFYFMLALFYILLQEYTDGFHEEPGEDYLLTAF
jgi:hypothetical protein